MAGRVEQSKVPVPVTLGVKNIVVTLHYLSIVRSRKYGSEKQKCVFAQVQENINYQYLSLKRTYVKELFSSLKHS